jgi:hypothetical protein
MKALSLRQSVDVDAGLTVSFEPTAWSPSSMPVAIVVARIDASIGLLHHRIERLTAAREAVARREQP